MRGDPAAPPVLLVHGMAGNAHWWDGPAAILARDFHTVSLDLRGHGDSGWARPPRYEIGDYAADIESARKHFGWERFHLVAHSMGARAALQYAAENPARLASLTAVDFLTDFEAKASRKFRKPALLRQPRYGEVSAMAARFRLEPPETRLSPGGLQELALKCAKRTELGWTWKFDWQAFFATYLPIWHLMPLLKVPTLVVRGELSDVMPRASWERVLNELAGSTGAEVKAAFHHVPLDAPDELAGLIARHLLAHPTASR